MYATCIHLLALAFSPFSMCVHTVHHLATRVVVAVFAKGLDDFD